MTGPRRSDGGSTTVELVLLAPVFLILLLFVVGVGRLADAHGQLVGAARDAARAASQTRDPAAAASAAKAAAAADLAGDGITCARFAVSTDTSKFRPGGVISVEVTCTTRLADVAMAGFPGHKTLGASATAPLETYRGTSP